MMELPKLSIVEATLDQLVDNLDRLSRIRFSALLAHARMVAEKISRYNLPMSPKAQELLEQARQLPPDEQEWLAEFLLIKDERVAADLESAWSDEIKRRLDEIDSGAVKMIPNDEFLADLDAHISSKQRE